MVKMLPTSEGSNQSSCDALPAIRTASSQGTPAAPGAAPAAGAAVAGSAGAAGTPAAGAAKPVAWDCCASPGAAAALVGALAWSAACGACPTPEGMDAASAGGVAVCPSSAAAAASAAAMAALVTAAAAAAASWEAASASAAPASSSRFVALGEAAGSLPDCSCCCSCCACCACWESVWSTKKSHWKVLCTPWPAHRLGGVGKGRMRTFHSALPRAVLPAERAQQLERPAMRLPQLAEAAGEVRLGGARRLVLPRWLTLQRAAQPQQLPCVVQGSP